VYELGSSSIRERSLGNKASKTLAPISVDTGVLAPKERFDFLNDVYARERLILAPRQPIGTVVSAGTTLWEVGSLRYALTHSSGHIGRRVKDNKTSFLAIRKHFTGGCHSWSDDGYFATQPGDIIVTLNTVDGVHACTDLDTTNLALPLDVLDFDANALKTTLILPANSLGNRLLSIAMEAWTEELRSIKRDALGRLEQDIISLVNHVLGPSLRPEETPDSVAAARGKAMRRYLQENALSASVDVADLSKTFGASRASIYREFAPEGGVQKYVAALRLRKALILLNASPATRGVVGRVSAQIGYEDPLHFSRAFRKHFGFSPSEALALQDPSPRRRSAA